MGPKLLLLVLLSACATSLASQFPFVVEVFPSTNITDSLQDPPIHASFRIAIIGAGAGGSSAAFWISKARERFGIDVHVDVYEKEGYIGGRSTVVYPYDDNNLPPLELGASIFAKANKNLWRASDEFNLTRTDVAEEDYAMGFWDGQNLLFSYKGGWWDTAKLLWRYGYFAPTRTQAVVQNMVNKFITLYNRDTPRWDDISDLASAFNWTHLTSKTTSEYLSEQKVDEKYVFKFVEAATRTNYGQNVDQIHALEGAASMAANGAAGIVGGNFQIFERFLKESGANVKLNTTVTSIVSNSACSHPWTVSTNAGSINYTAIIIAAPIHQSGISLPSNILSQVPKQPYVNLHVTLLSTTSPTLNPEYFGLAPSADVPRVMLTTYQGVRQGGKEPEFNSLSYHGQIREGEWAVKIFSKERIEDDWLQNMFNNSVGWVYRKEWKAYPELPPTTEFPPITLDRGLYYVNSFEPFISCMETETISSRNVVDLLLTDEFDSGICGSIFKPAEEEEAGGSVDKDFVFGWDC